MTYKESDSKYKRYTITSALPYANGPVHIGHLAGVYVPADIYARYLRQCGEDVIFIGGSDEHGVPITIKARKEGVSPQQVVDRYHEIIRSSFEQLGISFDIYSRTSCEEHHRTAAAYFKELYDKGVFVKRSSMQYYDEEASQFLADRYITGTCPHCGNEHAYGDQCEACGTSLNATDLINPRSTLSGNPPVMRETEHWYLPLDRYEEWLRSWIVEGHKGDWKTNVYGQCKSWIDAGLQPRAVTRDLDWGVKVPIEGADGKVLYVWFDAPIGYISFTKQLKGDDWERWWKADDTKLVHFIGKDNIVFHCIIFPTMLKAEGSYIMPANVPANEFLNLEGNKISTSRNWAVWLHEYLQEMPGKQDVLRYTLCANAPETKDNDFTWKDFQLKNNSELVAILGNFVNRTLVLTHKFYDGKVPEAQLDERDRATLQEMATYPERIGPAIERYTFREALSDMMNLARLGNRYLTETEPWKQIKQQPERAAASLYVSLQICAALSIVCEPFLPFTAAKLGKMLNLGASSSQWRQAAECQLPSGHAIATPELLFEQIPDETIAAQVAKLEATKQANEAAAWQPAPVKQAIVFDDFTKLDLRVGTVLECSRVPKADKLLSFRIDDGMGGRTIVSGIAKYYTDPSQLVGRQVCFIANLPPRKLKGIESQGMILSAEDKDGRLVLLTPDSLVAQGVNIG